MKKFLLLAISLLLLALPNAQARNSAASYDNKYYSQQEWVQAYNVTTAPMYRDYVVGLDAASIGDTSPTINPNVNLGQYVTMNTNSTTDSIYVFGVTDEYIAPGQLGRICIRGPHKVVYNPTYSQPVIGTTISQCRNNQTYVGYTGTTGANGGFACAYSTSTGTPGGALGYILSATATTDTGDQGTGTNGATTTESEYWAWISPQILR